MTTITRRLDNRLSKRERESAPFSFVEASGMAKAAFATVDDYIAAQPASAQAALKRVRAAILDAVPGATESISYNMPAYKLGKTRLLQFAAWSDHYALYVATAPIVAALKNELRNCEIDTGTIRFPLSDPVPEKLIGRIAKTRAHGESAQPARKR